MKRPDVCYRRSGRRKQVRAGELRHLRCLRGSSRFSSQWCAAGLGTSALSVPVGAALQFEEGRGPGQESSLRLQNLRLSRALIWRLAPHGGEAAACRINLSNSWTTGPKDRKRPEGEETWSENSRQQATKALTTTQEQKREHAEVRKDFPPLASLQMFRKN